MVDPTLSHGDYYVYVLFRRDTGEPFYVGYGRGRRWMEHEKLAKRPLRPRDYNAHKRRIIKQMQRLGLDVPKVRVAENLTLEQAKETERIFIQAIGRTPLGPLVNLTDGGDGPSALAEEARQKIAAFRRGKQLSVEHRQNIGIGVRLSEAFQEGMRLREQRNRERPQHVKDEIRAKQSLSLRGRIIPPTPGRIEAQRRATEAAAIANRGRPKSIPKEHLAKMTVRATKLARQRYEEFLGSLPLDEIEELHFNGTTNRQINKILNLGLTRRVLSAVIKLLVTDS